MNLYFSPAGGGYLQTVIASDKWEFVLCRDANTWIGEIANSELEASAADLGQEKEEYQKTALLALSGSDNANLCTDTEEIEGGIEVSWKKITESGVKFRLGSVLLKPTENYEIKGVLKKVATTISQLRDNLANVERELGAAQAEKISLASQLQDFARLKVESESELFAKFVLILNEKKAKIKALQNAYKNGEKVDSPEKTDISDQDQPGTSKPTSTPSSSGIKREAKALIHEDSFTGELQDSIAKLPKRSRQRAAHKVATKIPPPKRAKVEVENNADASEDNDTFNASEMLDEL